MRTLLAIVAATMLAAAASARAGQDPIVFGGSLSLTGHLSEMGRMQERGYLLWEAETNRRGGLLGRPVKVAIRDDESRPENVDRIYKDLLRPGNADLLFAPFSAAFSTLAADIAEKNRTPLLIDGTCSLEPWRDPREYVFGVYTTEDRYLIGFLEMCAGQRIRTVAVAGFRGPDHLAVAEGVRKWAGRFGLTIVRYTILDPSRPPEIDAEAARIASARPEAVVVAGGMGETVAMRRALERTGFRKYAFAGTTWAAMPRYRELLGSLAEGAFAPSHWEPTSRLPYPGSEEFIAAYRNRFGDEPTFHAAAAYAAGELLADAVRKTRSLSREKIRRHLARGRHNTVIGAFRIRENGVQAGHQSLIVQWQRGMKEIVWPESLRTAPPVFGRREPR